MFSYWINIATQPSRLPVNSTLSPQLYGIAFLDKETYEPVDLRPTYVLRGADITNFAKRPLSPRRQRRALLGLSSRTSYPYSPSPVLSSLRAFLAIPNERLFPKGLIGITCSWQAYAYAWHTLSKNPVETFTQRRNHAEIDPNGEPIVSRNNRTQRSNC